MLDIEQKETHMAWGLTVERQANGRLEWPAAIKEKAVERILGGETIISIATEIGANQSLVVKWVSAIFAHANTHRSAQEKTASVWL